MSQEVFTWIPAYEAIADALLARKSVSYTHLDVYKRQVEEILGTGVELRAEELAKQRLAFPRLGVEDRGEIVLGDHNDATELVGVDAQELDDGFRDVGIARGK